LKSDSNYFGINKSINMPAAVMTRA
jgi:hypothetical protein